METFFSSSLVFLQTANFSEKIFFDHVLEIPCTALSVADMIAAMAAMDAKVPTNAVKLPLLIKSERSKPKASASGCNSLGQVRGHHYPNCDSRERCGRSQQSLLLCLPFHGVVCLCGTFVESSVVQNKCHEQNIKVEHCNPTQLKYCDPSGPHEMLLLNCPGKYGNSLLE